MGADTRCSRENIFVLPARASRHEVKVTFGQRVKRRLKRRSGIWEGKDEGRKSCKMKASFTIKAGTVILFLRWAESCSIGIIFQPANLWLGRTEVSNYLIRTAVFSSLSAVLTARLILNMREVTDTDSMAVGDVSSVEASTVEWNDIDGIPMEDTRGHVRNRASRGYGNYFE
ncbi:hypothetical protein B0H14DRAFT_2614848 [Mycena olivaceomarginata]|jgi:hypothetical protein|nr:hypothetical protein B0H14DRAFT_2614848 [Mycena olivaceomarginata]